MLNRYIKCVKDLLLNLFTDPEEQEGTEQIEKKLNKMFKVLVRYDFVYSGFEYKNDLMKYIMWQFKFRGNKEIALLFRKYLFALFAKLLQKEKINIGSGIILIPIPIHKKRLAERGYNQSLVLSEILLKEIQNKNIQNIRIENEILLKKKNSQKQSWKNKQDRLSDAQNYFYIGKQKIDYNFKTIILIDDIVTSGATLISAKNILCEQFPNKNIFAITVAR